MPGRRETRQGRPQAQALGGVSVATLDVVFYGRDKKEAHFDVYGHVVDARHLQWSLRMLEFACMSLAYGYSSALVSYCFVGLASCKLQV